jgi:hypothetical protein
MKHKVGDLVYYKANKKVFADKNQPSIGIIAKCFPRKDTYWIEWLNDSDVLYQKLVMTEFSGQAIGWFKRDLQEVLGNDGTQNR